MRKRKNRKVPKRGKSRQKTKAKRTRRDKKDIDTESQYWWPPDGPEINRAWFYIPLRFPLKLPDGYIRPIGSPYNIHYPDQELTELIGLMGPLENPVGVSMSICVHQIEGNTNNSEIEAAMAASQRRTQKDKPDIVPLNTPIVTTVLECATSLESTSLDNMEEALTLAFEKVTVEVNGFLRNYAMLTNNRIALIHRETLPWSIPAAWSLGHEGSNSMPGTPGLFLVNLFDPSIMGMSATLTEELSEEHIVENGDGVEQVLDSLAVTEELSEDDIVDMLALNDAYTDPLREEIHTMLLDARLALQRGERAVYVVLLASGCELHLRLLLEVLLWEDGLSARDAVNDLFTPNGIGHPISYILKSKLHSRLGGTWDITSDSNPVGRFYKTVFERRNSYLHTGTPITQSDADAASEAATAFLEFTNTQLSTKLSSYPFAAARLIGEPVITHMGIRERIDAALRTKESELPLSPLMYDCSSHFEGYRREVEVYKDSNIQGGAPLVGEVNEHTHVALLVYPNGGSEYWLIDPDRSVACRADNPNMSAEQAKSIKKLTKQAKRQPSNELRACRLLDVPAIPLESPPTWVSAHKVWRMEHMQD